MSRQQKRPRPREESDISGEDILNITNLDILSESTSLNVSMCSSQCLMNENEEILTYWDYKKVKWDEVKNWMVMEEGKIEPDPSLKFVPI